MKSNIELIKNQLDIVQLISEKVKLKKTGKNWIGLCPFHKDKHPSFTVSSEIGRYKCWSCGAAGDIFSWVTNTEQLEFIDALKYLAEKAGVPLQEPNQNIGNRSQLFHVMEQAQSFFVNQLKNNEKAKNYLLSRGLSEKTIEEWGLGFSPDYGDALSFELKKKQIPLYTAKDLYLIEKDASGGFYDRFKGRITFPIHNYRGNIIAYGARTTGSGHPKYLNSSDTPLFQKRQNLYGFYQSKPEIAKNNTTILVEGYLDVIACHQAGIKNVVASLGTAFSEEQAKLLSKWCNKVIILYDSDDAGIKAANKAAEILKTNDLTPYIVILPKGEDPDSLIKKEGVNSFNQILTQKLDYISYQIFLLKKFHSPDDSIFWDKVYQLLPKCTDPLMVEKHILELSHMHPELNDPMAAREAIRKKIFTAQKKYSAPSYSNKTILSPTKKTAFHPYEEIIFRSLRSTKLCEKAIEFCANHSWFLTKIGVYAAKAIHDVYMNKPFTTLNANILDSIQIETTKDALIDLYMFETLSINENVLDDAIKQIEKKKHQKDLQSMKQGAIKDDELLAQISKQLKNISR